jgi:chromate reductase
MTAGASRAHNARCRVGRCRGGTIPTVRPRVACGGRVVSEAQITVLGIAGSLRRASYNRGLLRAAQAAAPDGVTIDIFDLASLPFYDEDLEAAGPPDAVQALRARIHAADALLLAAPEYNHSFTAVLKNALDWASRPRADPSLRHKPVALMGAGGAFGTVRAQMALRPVLTSNEMYVLPSPGVHVFNAPQHFDTDGNLTDEQVRASVAGLVHALAAWTRRLRPV